MEETLPFDEDLQKIVADRALMKLREFRRNLETFGCSVDAKQDRIRWDDPDFWESYFSHILKHEVFVGLRNEAVRYQKRYPKSDYETDIERARNGKGTYLFRIIGWDKAWLFVDWVKQRILNAQENGDLGFLRGIGDAISRKPGRKKTARGEDKENSRLVFALVESAIIYHKIGLPADRSNRFFRRFHDILVNQEFFPDSLYDFDYFMKKLRRHNLIR